MKKLTYMLAAFVTIHAFATYPAAETAAQPEATEAAAPDKSAVTVFEPSELPQKKGVDLFDLGKVTKYTEIKKIPGPKGKEDFVQFNLTTESGLPASFLIRRVDLTPERRRGLRASSKGKQRFKEQVDALTAGGTGVVTSFYYRHPSQQGANEWIEVYSVTDGPSKYSFSPTFDAGIYPNGLIVLDIKGRQNLIFGVGEKFAQQLISKDGQIEVGGGKTLDARKLYKANI